MYPNLCADLSLSQAPLLTLIQGGSRRTQEFGVWGLKFVQIPICLRLLDRQKTLRLRISYKEFILWSQTPKTESLLGLR